MRTRALAVIAVLCSLALSGCSLPALKSLPNLPSHWRNVKAQGIDTRVGHFESTKLELTIHYDIGRLAGEYAQVDAHPTHKWFTNVRLHGSSFRSLLDHDDILYMTFLDEGPANFWVKISNQAEIDYVYELLARYRRDLLGL